MGEEMDHVRRYLASNRASLVLIFSPIGQASAARPGGFRQVQVEAGASGEAVWSVLVLSRADASGETVRDAVSRAWAYPFVAELTEAGGEESGLGRAVWSRSDVAAMCERLSFLVVNAREDGSQ
jgi:hypothetical protein